MLQAPSGDAWISSRFQILTERPPGLHSKLDRYTSIRGAGLTDGGVGALLPDYFSILANDLASIEPSRKKLHSEDEDRLDRHCYVLALLDELFRGGYHIRSPLYDVPSETPPHGLLELGAAWSEDLGALYHLFWNEHRSMFDLPVSTNPHFAGSAAIGGADADLIIDNQLIEIKTTNQADIATRDCVAADRLPTP
jgi:hypothetical protein